MRYNDALVKDQVSHVGKKIGQNYNIVTTPDPWVAKMIFHHSKPGGGLSQFLMGRMVGQFVVRTMTNVALVQRYTYCCFEDKY